MFTSGSAVNAFWSDNTAMDNLRAAHITATSFAGSLQTIGANTAATNVRGGHTVHTASTGQFNFPVSALLQAFLQKNTRAHFHTCTRALFFHTFLHNHERLFLCVSCDVVELKNNMILAEGYACSYNADGTQPTCGRCS
jgi:hypothetical protein